MYSWWQSASFLQCRGKEISARFERLGGLESSMHMCGLHFLKASEQVFRSGILLQWLAVGCLYPACRFCLLVLCAASLTRRIILVSRVSHPTSVRSTRLKSAYICFMKTEVPIGSPALLPVRSFDMQSSHLRPIRMIVDRGLTTSLGSSSLHHTMRRY